MARRNRPTAADLLGDFGVLGESAVLEAFGFGAVQRAGGVAFLPWRDTWMQAQKCCIAAVSDWSDVVGDTFSQAVVHLQKSRAATWVALVASWNRLEPDGSLLLVGGNELGIKSAVKRLSAELDQTAEIMTNRAHSRVARWRRTDHRGPVSPAATSIQVTMVEDGFSVDSAPGVFSADAVDPGTALLLGQFESLDRPHRIFDPGCGLGILGLAALRRWKNATGVLADADHRAVACARTSAVELGVGNRCDIAWWDAECDPPPLASCDLILLNPPFHRGVAVDLQPARAIFRAIDAVLEPGGQALIVANRTLPWERDLREIGNLATLVEARGYKVLKITR